MWPSDLIERNLEGSAPPLHSAQLEHTLEVAGYGPRLAGFLAPLYAIADGGRFYNGGLRLLPIGRSDGNAIVLNAPDAWKPYAPEAGRSVFYFMCNGFGDLFGVPLENDVELARDRLALLWLEQYKAEETALSWTVAITKLLQNEQGVGTYLARLSEYQWACSHLGVPDEGYCFSMKVPVAMGGPATIENVEVAPIGVHIAFTLQLMQQAGDTQEDR
jgi:hypothetical protein